MENFPEWRFEKNDWQEKTLGEIAESFTYGLNAKAVKFDGVHKFLRITDIDETSRRFTQEKLTSPDCNCDEKFLAQEGDIFFARAGTLGRTYVYKKNDGKLYHSGSLIRVRIKKNFVPYFIHLQTLTERFRNWLKFMSKGTAQLVINAEEYKTFKFKIPPFEEQQKIANYFLELDKALEIQETKLLNWRELKKGLLQKIFSREWKFTDEHGNFYPDWTEKTLEKVTSEFRSGKTLKVTDIFKRGLYPIYGGNGFRGYANYFTHEGEYVLIGRVGALCGNIHFVTGKNYFSEHAVAVRANKENSTKFLERVFTNVSAKCEDEKF